MFSLLTRGRGYAFWCAGVFFLAGRGEVVVVDKVHREINFLYVLANPYFVCIPLTF